MMRIITTVAVAGALLSGLATTAFATGNLTDCSLNSTYQGERSWCLENERNAQPRGDFMKEPKALTKVVAYQKKKPRGEASQGPRKSVAIWASNPASHQPIRSRS
jgi:hypothetical protein